MNRTAVRPDEPDAILLSTPLDYDHKERVVPLPDGAYGIRPRSGGYLALLPAGYPSGEEPSVDVMFRAEGAAWGSLAEGMATKQHVSARPDATDPMTVAMNGIRYHSGAYPEGAREWSFSGADVAAQGAGVFQVRASDVVGPEGAWVLPDYPMVVHNQTVPANAARVTTYLLEEAFLRVAHFTLATDGATWACGPVDAAINGELTVLQATGMAVTPEESHAFEGKVLSLGGSFKIAEEPATGQATGAVAAEAAGRIDVVGIDFLVVAVPAAVEEVLATVGLVTLVLAGLAAAGKKGFPAVTVLFARLRDRDILAHQMRAEILEHLAGRCILSQTELVDAIGGSRGTIRHHIDILVHANVIGALNLRGETLLYETGVAREQVFQGVIQRDEWLAAIDEMVQQGVDRPKITKAIADRHGVTARTARKHVQRYFEIRHGGVGSGTTGDLVGL